MKFTLSEKNLQGINSGENEAKNKINNLKHMEEKSIQSEQQEEEKKKKNKDRLRSLWDISTCSNIWIKGVPEGEEEEQQIKTYLKKNNERRLP